MLDTNQSSIPSADFLQLQSLFRGLNKPYGAGEIVRFNLAYSRMYLRLSQQEKRRTEALVDELIENLEDTERVTTRYGVT